MSSGEQSLDGSIDEERGALSDSDVNHVARAHVGISVCLASTSPIVHFKLYIQSHDLVFPIRLGWVNANQRLSTFFGYLVLHLFQFRGFVFISGN